MINEDGGSDMIEKIKKIDGNTLVQIAMVIVVLLGVASLAIDGGLIFAARNQLQSAVDASVLAAASGLIVGEDEATAKAIAFARENTCINRSVNVSSGDVTFPAVDQVRVSTDHTVQLYFGRIFGVRTANITAEATAALGTLTGSGNIKPWAIPDLDYTLGEQVVLKSGQLGAPGTNPSYYYPVDFPPVNRGTPIPGAQTYWDNIINGSDGPIFIGDELLVEPGNMIGPTRQAVTELIAMDPGAYWAGDQVAGSAFAEFGSPRICKIAMFDIDFPPDSGRNSVIVISLGAFFLESMQGQDVIGRFMEITTGGIWGDGPSDLLGVKLIN
jgi:hypothetical protein